jgi:hypothetical protein
MSREFTLQIIWDYVISVDNDKSLKVKSTIFWPTRLVGLKVIDNKLARNLLVPAKARVAKK